MGGSTKGSLKKKFIKGAAIGVGAYAGYKVAKLAGKFAKHSLGYRFHDWDDWREVDGMLCRTSNDCNWINPQLYCQDYEVKFNTFGAINQNWFGGRDQLLRIVGECACPPGTFLDDDNFRCVQVNQFFAPSGSESQFAHAPFWGILVEYIAIFTILLSIHIVFI